MERKTGAVLRGHNSLIKRANDLQELFLEVIEWCCSGSFGKPRKSSWTKRHYSDEMSVDVRHFTVAGIRFRPEAIGSGLSPFPSLPGKVSNRPLICALPYFEYELARCCVKV